MPRITARTSITYGEIAERLRRDLQIGGKIFATHIGYVVGPLQDRIHEVDPNAHLLNVLIVRADSEQSGSGVDGYLKRKYGLSKRAEIGSNQKSDLLQRAAAEVYAFRRWLEIYRKVFESEPPSFEPADDIDGAERDGQTFGGPSESEEHKRLKAHVLANPYLVGAKGPLVEKRNEYCLMSGDEVDVFFAKADEFWLVEVKSERSNERDMMRGCYQAIKYRAVFQAQLRRTFPSARVNTVLVTRTPLAAGAKSIASDNNVRHVLI